jgi:hypothetical protein
MVKYPSTSPHVFANSNPILFIDADGKEWVNSHTENLKKLNQLLIDNPDDKKLKKQIRNEKELETRVNELLGMFEENDEALYNYVDNLRVQSYDGKSRNVKVFVSASWLIKGENGQTGETGRHNYSNEPNVLYEGQEIVMPKSDKGWNTFDIVIYGMGSFGDVSLANEVGDVMFYMEYNEDSVEGQGNNKVFENATFRAGQDLYMQSDSYKYSNSVEKTYETRKKDGTGKDPKNNPYPIKKKE